MAKPSEDLQTVVELWMSSLSGTPAQEPPWKGLPPEYRERFLGRLKTLQEKLGSGGLGTPGNAEQ